MKKARRYPLYLTSRPLRENVRLLGQILGQVILEVEGEAFFRKVERTRRFSKKARQGDSRAQTLFQEELRVLPVPERERLAKAFTEFLRLANLAEQTHRVRRRRAYERKQGERAEHTLSGMLERMLRSGVPAERLLEALGTMQIDLVLTAHPTEAQTIGAIRRYRRIHECLDQLDLKRLSPYEREACLARLKNEILALWLSGVVPERKPTPQEEAELGLELVEEILWDALGRFQGALNEACLRTLGKGVPLRHPPVRFGSWMGGDRDGNPFVTAQVTSDVLRESLARGRRLIRRELRALSEELDFRPSPLRPDLSKEISIRMDALWAVCARLEQEASARQVKKPASAEDLLVPLFALRGELERQGLSALARGRLDPLIWRVQAFGLALLPLDLRQEASRHEQAVAEILGSAAGYVAATEERRCELLRAELRAPRSRALPETLSEETREVIETMRLLVRFPRDCFGTYVISMAAHPSDLLAVQALMRWAGVEHFPPIAPLFETPDALRGALATLQTLWGDAQYRESIGDRQEIMLGYSDSAKRSGRFASSWAIHDVQREVLALGRSMGVSVLFFHGRGGSIDRGGGPILTALRALPRPLTSDRIRVTEQGESIFVKFGLPEMAERTLELYVAGFLDAVTAVERPVPREWEALAAQLARDSESSFRKWIYENPRFADFFYRVTPASELSVLKIGSRPAKRQKGRDLDSLRAIPWVFAWTQTRGLVPAWLGIGSALDKALAGGKLKQLRQMYQEWPFFQATLGLIEMSLAKTDLEIFQSYVSELGNGGSDQTVGRELFDRLEIARRSILKVTGHTYLLENRRLLARSIRIRNPYVDILNRIQIGVLKEYRASQDSQLESALAMTIAGVSAGMRNTG